MTIEPSLIVWTVLCFLALVLILKKLLFDPMLSFMDARSAKIEAARKAREATAAEHDAEARRLAAEHAEREAKQRDDAAAALETTRAELSRLTAEKRAEAARRLEENQAALNRESDEIYHKLEPELSGLALDIVNHLQKWQDDRHSAVDAEAVAAPYADVGVLAQQHSAGEHTN